jgi:hypothetical protein
MTALSFGLFKANSSRGPACCDSQLPIAFSHDQSEVRIALQPRGCRAQSPYNSRKKHLSISGIGKLESVGLVASRLSARSR